MDQQVGSGSLCFAKAPFIIGTASVVGTKEGEGPLADAFDCIGPDDKFGQQTWEAAESSLQKEALTLALGKADQKPEDMRYLFAGDLLGQLIASSFGLKTFEIPVNLKWSFGLGSMFGAYIAAGPQFGFNIGNKKGFMDYELKKNNTTFNVGAGVKLIRHIQIGVNYNFALSHTATIETTNEEVIKIKNNTWQVSLAYLF